MTRREAASAVLFLIALSVYVTWPQALHLRDAVVRHDDPFFSMWRLAWIGHALTVSPHHLYDANIFFPEPRTLAYSDATLLQGALAAPLLWIGVSTITVYNLLLLAGIAGSGIGMLVLVQQLTGNSRAAIIAATLFTVLPYRIEHVMHLELQWTAWIPLTWWAMHRAFAVRTLRRGTLVGVLLWLQVLSCVYYGIYLGLTLTVLGGVMLLAYRGDRWGMIRVGVVAASLAVPLTIVYARPYLHNTRAFGPRGVEEVARFSATPMSYLTAPATNLVWGTTADRFAGDELHLFPGLVAMALAVLAAASARRRLVVVYAAVAAFAVVMSLGEHAFVYPWVREHLFVLRGFRAAARFSIIAFAAMAVLAAAGYEWIEWRLATRMRRSAVMVTCLVALGLEATPVPARLAAADRRSPDVYRILRALPAAPVVEFPTADPAAIPGWDAIFMFESTFHWRPMVNGYSGYVSDGYVSRLEQLRRFPDRRALECLDRLGVRYAIVHEALYPHADLPDLLLAIAQEPSLTLIGRYRGPVGRAQLFEIRKSSPP